MIAFTKAHTYFKQINCELLGLSVDSNAAHLAWMYDIYCKTGIKISFPIIADRNGAIARKYGMISSDISNTEAVRNVFVIDDKGIVRTILIYPMNIGRFVPEIMRIVQALQMADCTNGSIPANWMPHQPVIVQSPTAYCELEERLTHINENKNGMTWYLSFKNPDKKCIEQKSLDEKCDGD